MSAPVKPQYRTTNWKEHNEALKARGSLLIWVDEDMRWHGSASGKRNRSGLYGEAAIQFCLTIKSLFSLPLHQAMGIAQSLLKLASLHWRVPDFISVL
jgi:hypothetical protein